MGSSPGAQDEARLPRTVVPSRYDLTIAPDLEAATFEGTVAIAVDVRERVPEIVLHALELEIDAAWVVTEGAGRTQIDRIELDEEAQCARLHPPAPLEAGSAVLHLSFHGILNDRLHGFYRSTYSDEEGRSHTIATTQFEAADARRAFPCWDEPDRKAVFGVTLVIPADAEAVSCGPEIERTREPDGRVRVRFADTMTMSTYLVAFVVGRLEISQPVVVDGVPIRVVHVPGKGHLTDFALEAAAHALRFFSGYYGMPYPDHKVDMVALPDFAHGAMENTGCITYRESLVLVDPEQATQPELEDIADVVAHELAHQWFGNLVTMRWWNGIWLNEAFATFMALLAVEDWRPDWEGWASFARTCSIAKEVDALHSTRAIEYPVHSPDDAAGMFDILTYQKGGATLRMLERYLGAEAFRDGIRLYLRRHAHGNTETHDLWEALEEASGEPVRRIMDQWIWQGGYPLLTATPEPAGVRLEQRRFLADGGPDGTTWDVPLRVRELDGGERSVLVPAEGALVPVGEGAAVVVNGGAGSFARAAYGGDLLDRLLGRLDDVSPLERYGLVDDHWAAVTSGVADASSFLAFAGGFAEEDDLAVWQALLLGLGWCDRFVEDEARGRLRAFVRALIAPALDRLGWEAGPGDSDLAKALRGTLLQGLGILGADPNAGAAARELEGEARAGAPVDPALAAAAVNVVARTGDGEDYERFWARTTAAPTPQEQLRYLYALPLFRDPDLLDRTMRACLTGEIRSQNAPFVVASAMAGRDLGPRAWAFMRDHWEELVAAFPSSLMIRMADGVRFLSRPGEVREAETFFQGHPIPQSVKTLEQILERQRVAAALRTRAEPALTAYLTGPGHGPVPAVGVRATGG